MKTNANHAVFRGETTVIIEGVKHTNFSFGLTKREYFAALAMQGLLANSYSDGTTQPLSIASHHEIACMSVDQADALISQLNKEF